MGARATAAYIWEDPGASITIELGLDVLKRLGSAIQQGMGVGLRGREIGGLLLGRFAADNSRAVRIDDFELVPCQHWRGESYTLAPKERQALGKRVERHHPGQVVGFFRSHTRPGLYLDEDDFAVVSNYFAEESQVVLLVRPATGEPATAGFFFWEDGELNRRAPYRQFPFDANGLAVGDLPVANETAIEPARLPEKPQKVAAWNAPPGLPRPWASRIPWLAVPVLAASFLVVGLIVSETRGKQASPPGSAAARPAPGLALEVEQTGGSLRVRWDPNAPAIRTADLGLLRITDGTRNLRRELDPQELAGGSTIYSPVTGNVKFELQVFALTEKTGRSVQEAVPPAPAVDSRPATNVAVAPEAPPPQPGGPKPSPVAQKQKKAAATPKPAPVVQAAVVSKPSNPPPSPPPAIAYQPELAGVLPDQAAAPPPVAEVSYEAPHPGALKRAFHRISSIGGDDAAQGYAAPTPVHRVTPAVPRGAQDDSTAVDVKVYIDESGNVTRAHLLGKGGDLADAALNAARQWQFSPARKHDRPVPAELVLHFRFAATSRHSVTAW